MRGSGGYVVAPPSKKGDLAYRWIKAPGTTRLADLPKWLAELLQRRQATIPAYQNTLTETRDWCTLDEARELLEHIDPDVGYHDWLHVLMALKDQFGESGFDLAKNWSSKGVKYIPGEVAAKWRSFKPKSSTKKRTIRTLRTLARDAGADVRGIELEHHPEIVHGFAANPYLAFQRNMKGPLFQPISQWEGLPVPEVQWHVRDFIPANDVTLLSGDGGNGKSLLAMQLAAATAIGQPWLNQTVERIGKAFYLSAEDSEKELHRRFAAIASSIDVPLKEIDVGYTSRAASESILATFEHDGSIRESCLQETIKAELDRERPTLLVLDTLADLHTENEIEKTVARQFISLQRSLAIQYGCTILILAHPSLSGIAERTGRSGNTGWSNSARSRLFLERLKENGHEASPNARRLTNNKLNYGPAGREINITWQDGIFVADPEETDQDRMKKDGKAEQVFLKLLEEFTAENRRVRHTTGHGYAPKVFVDSGRAEGVSKEALRCAMERLLKKGIVKVEIEGPPSKKTSYLVVDFL